MPTYKFRGQAHSPATIEIKAKTIERAQKLASENYWDKIVVEGKPSSFTVEDDDGPTEEESD